MNRFFSILLRLMITLPVAAFIGAAAYNQMNLSALLASLIAAATGGAIYFGLGKYADARLYKKHGLTRKEYNYILENLKEARKKLSRLQSVFIRLRSISSFKQILELNRLVRRIYFIVKKDPKKFYDAESFFYSHLNSVVELAEKYAYLNTQKIKDHAVKTSLLDTKDTLGDLTKSLEKDLQKVLANDIDQLSFELDVAKHSIKRLNLNNEEDERGNKKP